MIYQIKHTRESMQNVMKIERKHTLALKVCEHLQFSS